MIVVFTGLVILIGCIKLLSVAFSRRKTATQADPKETAGTAAPVAAPAPAAPPRTYVPGPRLTRKDDAFYAVISAAVASTLQSEGVNPEGGFAIRSITTIHEPKDGPALTPKDDAFYAVATAAIGQVLEGEGVNPEGGFAIRSVKAL